tara:strand:- start:1104 stop:1616 length:513 start_codon:yes stop_codon:yes gene_type:complete
MNNEKNNLLMNKIECFFDNEFNKNILIRILNNEFNISLRVIDWFVTNYCKKNNIFWIENNARFVVYLSYKLQLKAYSKKYFDPFCRRDRIYFSIKNNDYIETTVGQLNFFKWIIEHNIINYIKNNYEDIEKDMQNTIKLDLEKNIKRRQLSKSATKTINIDESKIIIKFE